MYDPVEAIGRSRDDLIRGGGAFREAAAALGPVTAKDDSGAVTVTVDAEGRISSILVSITWRNSYTAHSLAAGVTEAATKAGVARLEQWGSTVVKADERPSGRVVAPTPLDADGLASRLSEAVEQDRSGSVYASMQVMSELLHELVDSIEDVRNEVREHLSREYTGRSASGHVTATTAGNGTLLDLTFDPNWLDSAHPANLGREATQAIHEAYRRAGGDDVATIVARSPLGRLQRLSEDPVALARAMGLRS
ncbi:MAG TPA: YbaB/EbfC family nucleoid-associated protein [Lapillicoccus sp.]